MARSLRNLNPLLQQLVRLELHIRQSIIVWPEDIHPLVGFCGNGSRRHEADFHRCLHTKHCPNTVEPSSAARVCIMWLVITCHDELQRSQAVPEEAEVWDNDAYSWVCLLQNAPMLPV